MINTVPKESDTAPDEMADIEEVCRLISEGKRVTDPVLLKRIYARSDRVHKRCSRSTASLISPWS